MSDDLNPYQPPQPIEAQVVGVNSGRMEDLRLVAGYQKGIIFCILGYFAAGATQRAFPFPVPLIIVLCVAVTGAVFVVLLALKVYPLRTGITLGILTLVPLAGLVALLLVNGKATAILKNNGHAVGLLGANLSRIPIKR